MDENPTSLRVEDPGIRELFTLDSRWQAWLDVEAALAIAEADLGMVPDAAAKEIVTKCKLELLNRENVIASHSASVGAVSVGIIADMRRRCRELRPLGRHHAEYHPDRQYNRLTPCASNFPASDRDDLNRDGRFG